MYKHKLNAFSESITAPYPSNKPRRLCSAVKRSYDNNLNRFRDKYELVY